MTTVEQAASQAADIYRKDSITNGDNPVLAGCYSESFKDGYLAGHASRDEEVKAKLNGYEAKRCANGHLPVYMHQEMQCPACWARERADECGAEIAALRAKLAEVEGRAAKWVKNISPEGDAAWKAGWMMVPIAGPPGMLLMVPPVPLPGEEG